jgi:hypothetical protein
MGGGHRHAGIRTDGRTDPGAGSERKAARACRRAAFTHPEFRAKLPHFPSSVAASPHLFQKVAVPGFCVA